MTQHLIHVGVFLKKVVLSGLSLTILGITLLVICVQGFIVWLNTPAGGHWAVAQISTVSLEDGLQVELRGFLLSGLWGVQIGSLQIRDQDKALVMEVQNLGVSVNPFPLTLRHLSVDITAERLSIQKPFPSSQAESTPAEASSSPIIVPDLYFHSMDVDVLLRQIILSDAVVSQGITSSLLLHQDLRLTPSHINLSGQVVLGGGMNGDAPLFPGDHTSLKLENHISFAPQDQIVQVDHLSVALGNNRLDGQGYYDLSQKTFKASLDGIWSETAILSPDFSGPLSFKAEGTGGTEGAQGTLSLQSSLHGEESLLTARLSYNPQQVVLEELQGSFADLDVSGQGTLHLPELSYQGTLEGQFKTLKLVSLFAPEVTADGAGKFNLIFDDKNGDQSIDIKGKFSNLSYDDMRVGSVDITAGLPQIDQIDHASGSVHIQNLIAGETTLESLQLQLKPQKIQEQSGAADVDGLAVFLDGHGYNKRPFSVQGAAELTATPFLDVKKLEIHAGPRNLMRVQGQMRGDVLAFKMTGLNLHPEDFPFLDLSGVSLDLDEVTAVLSGTRTKPELTAHAVIHPADEALPPVSFEIGMDYANGQAQARFTGQGNGIRTLQATAGLPLSVSLQPFLFDMPERAALSGTAEANFKVAILESILAADSYHLGGDVSLSADLGGTLNLPELTGQIGWRDGSLKNLQQDLSLQDILVESRFQGREVTLTKFQARDGSGNGTLDGTGTFQFNDVNNPVLNAALLFKNLQIRHGNGQYEGILSGDVRLETEAQNYLISGQIRPETLSIHLPDQFATSIPALNVVETDAEGRPTQSGLQLPVHLALGFDAKNQIFVRGWGLDAELQGHLDITGTLASPQVNGQLNTIRGRYEEFGRRFAVEQAILRFQGDVPPSPYLDVRTTTNINDVMASVLITGSATAPKLSFSATPSLPEDEVLSYILFGQDLSKISPFQAIQLANTVRRFSGQGGSSLDVLGTVKDLTGLDDIRVEGVGTDDAKVGAGKYITDKVYLELEKGAAEQSGAVSVEVEVTPHITVESKAKQDGSSDVGLFWEWDY
ncbi:MAG: translocation/assembly module TamB domain-containing protein [Rhodospirillales bacterium]|nr:translocation/assembly module TamB domain-containing protein [Rhodospirillales bacterium]